jgi:glucokinase
MAVLAGDIGGTNARLALAEWRDGRCRLVAERYFESRTHKGLDSVLRAYMQETGAKIETACFGVAGPVQDGAAGQTVDVTNLPWKIDGAAIAREFGIGRVRLINDFQAAGYGTEALDATDLVVLQAGEPVPHGPRAIIGAGTGLGQALLLWRGDHYQAVATEGGHADFGPADELQLELLRYLMRNEGHASYELILSGAGLVRLYDFMRKSDIAAESPAVSESMQAGDPAAVITQAALQSDDTLCNRAVDLFVRIYGAQAGNLALTAGAVGGLFVAGGIAPRLIARIREGAFMQAFRNKGSMYAYAARVPVQVVLNTKVGLFGAALVALRLKKGEQT